MALGAPWFDDPDERHGHARIHLLFHRDGNWQHLGPALPDGFSPGSREWSGSAVLEGDDLTLYFTATGRRGEAVPTFEQRLISAKARLVLKDSTWHLMDWRDCGDIVIRDPREYMAGDEGGAAVGTIKAFRDPYYFSDPGAGAEYIVFAGSSARRPSAYNGVVGMAVRERGVHDWRLLPPIVSADGLNNELERPHLLFKEGLYYLFWCTQSHVFNPDGPVGPTGLYGMASRSLLGGWKPLNGTGLVFANPPDAPAQAYSWVVLQDLSVTSFANELAEGDTAFAGIFAPFLTLRLNGFAAELAS
jgi:levansucrase